MKVLEDERYFVQVESGGVTIITKRPLTSKSGGSYILDAAFFSEVAEAFREEHRKVQVFSNMEALYAALSLTQSPSALHTPKFLEVLVDDAKHTGQSHIEFTCSCGKVHSIRTQGDLDTFHREWYKPVMEGI